MEQKLLLFAMYYNLRQSAFIYKYGLQGGGIKMPNGSRKPPNKSHIYRSSDHHFWNLADTIQLLLCGMEIIWDVDDWTVPNIAAIYIIYNYFSNRYPHENYTTTIIFPSLWMSKCISQYLPGSLNHEKFF